MTFNKEGPGVAKQATTDRSKRKVQHRSGSPGIRTRSFACPDELWTDVEDLAARRGLGSTSDAVRLLLHSGLHTESVIDQMAAAREWQIAEAWADAQAIANGDTRVGSWETIARAAERARRRIRQRTGKRRSPASA